MKTMTNLIRFFVYKVMLPAIFTVALLVAFVSIGGNHARAQTAEQTVTDLLGTVSIPGLDSLPVSNLQITDSYKSVDVTVHGQTATLVVFKPTDADKNVVAVIPDNFSLSDFVPLPSGTPLDDITFSDMAFVIAQANISLTVADAPPPLSAALSHSGDTAALKSGVNIFGQADFTASNSVSSVLSTVGITNLTLPLNGSLPTNLFSQNPKTAAQSFKNEILDNLDINVPLPNISIPGVPSAVNIQHTNLTIKGKNDSGTRTLDVDVAGQLELAAGSKKVDFDFDVDVKKSAGKPTEVTISGQTTPGETLTFEMGHTFTLTDLTFTMDKQNGKWEWLVWGSSTFRKKPISINYQHTVDGKNRLNIHTALTLADIVGQPSLPGLDDVTLAWVQVYDDYWRMSVDMKGTYGYINIFKPEGSSNRLVAVTVGPETISPDKFIPGTANTPLKDVSFEGLSFVLAPKGAAGKLDRSQLPLDISYRLSEQAVPGDIILKSGLNVFGKMKITPSGEMASLLGEIGVQEVSLPLNGGFSTQAFSKDIAAIKNEIMANLDLNLPLPTPSIPGLDKVLTFNNGKLHIKGTMPDGSQGISVEVSGDVDVHFGTDSVDFAVDVTFDRALGGSETELKITGSTTTPWNNPFGMDWIDLTNLEVTFDEKTVSGVTDWDVSVDAKSTIGHHSNLDVTVNVTDENGVLTDATFTLDDPLDLSEVPGLKDIPEVKDLTINTLTASSHGIEAKTTFQGKETDFFAFETNSNWVIALSQDNFKITEIIPPMASTPLKHVVLSEASVLYAQSAINGTMSSFGPIAQTAFKRIYGTNPDGTNVDATINVDQGINLIAAFEHKKSTGKLSSGFTRFGMNQEKIILVGDIGGIMGDTTPHVNVQASLDTHGRPSHMPSWMSFASDATFVFSLSASGVGTNAVLEFGIGADVTTTVHGDTLIFDSKLAMEVQEEDIDIKFVMDLKTGNKTDGLSGTGGLNCTLTNTPTHSAPAGPAGWHRPFGIPGFTLYNVSMDLGIGEDGAVHLGYAGGAKVAGDRFCVTGDTDLLPEADFAPKDMAFIGIVDFVKSDFPENLAIQVATDLAKENSTTGSIVSKFSPQDISLMMGNLPQPEFKNVKFAYATPGASDPDLNIQGAGVALKGTLSWLGKDLGSIDMAITESTGLKVEGTIGEPKPDGTAGPLSLGPLDFKNTYLDLKVPFPPKNPLDGYFKLNADLTIPVVDVTEKIYADLTNKGMSFSVTNTILSDFSETLTLALSGVDLSVTHPDVSHADFAISGSLKADFGDFIKTALKNTMIALFAELNQTLQDGENKVKAKRKKVEDLNTKINHERAVVRAEKAKVEAKLETAQARVDAINKDIKHDWKRYHGCSYWHFWCKPKWAIIIGIDKGIKEVADLVLEAIEELVSHVPIDFDPRVWTLIAAKEVALTALDVALASIEGLDDLDKLATRGLDSIANFAGSSVNLKHASFNGDLSDIIASDAPVDLNIDLELFGSDFSETFAFKLGDAANELSNLGKEGAADTAHLAILAYVAADHLFNKVLSDIPEPFKRQLQRSIGEKIHKTQTALKTELATYKTDFQKYHKTAQALQADYSHFSDSYSRTMMQKRVTKLDKEPASKTFTDVQFELASTGICLTQGSRYNNTAMEDLYTGCAAEGEGGGHGSYAAQKISTINLLYKTGKKKGKPTGYVKILVGGKKCLTVPGKLKFEEVNYDNKIVEQEVFKPYTKYGDSYGGTETFGRLRLVDNCNDDVQNQWKILPHGEDYFQIHNRATQACIWMKSTTDDYGDYSNSLQMIPCVGANTGVFRIVKASPAVLHKVNLPLKRGYYQHGENYSQESNLDGNQSLCMSYGDSAVNWVKCDKPYNRNNNPHGYDTFDYFEDSLGRRRYVSKKLSNKCLAWSDNLFYTDCDSTNEREWLLTTQVVGGLTLAAPGDNITDEKITLGDKFPDPNDILYQPLNPRAGVEWSKKTSHYSGSEMDVAYTKAQQATSAINKRAREWTAIKTGLAAKDSDLAAGKQVCVKSGKNNYCYRLGAQTGYVDKAVPTGQTTTQLTDGTPIIADDVSDAQANKLAAVATITEPKWFLCHTKTSVINDVDAEMYFPGVVVHMNNCVFSEGKNKYNQHQFKVVKGGTDLFWQPAGNGYLPSSAAVTGRLSLNTETGIIDATNMKTGQLTGSTMAAYSCRAMIGRKTKIGWTIGGKYCHITTFAGGAVVKNFEVLTVNGSIAAPPPPPPPAQPKCTYQMVENYFYGKTWKPHCTPDQYNREHPDCHFQSRKMGFCDGGPP